MTAPRRRRLIVAGAVVAVGAVALAVTQLGGGSPHPEAAARSATTVAVVTTDVAETTPVNGTVGFASPSSLVQPAGVAPSALIKDQQAVAAATQALAADRQALADVGDADAQGASQAQQAIASAQAILDADTRQLHEDQATLAADQQKQADDCSGTGAGTEGSDQAGTSSPCSADAIAVSADQRAVSADQQKVLADQAAVQNAQSQAASGQQKAAQADHQAQAKLASDAAAVANAQAAHAADQAAAAAYEQISKYTALPAVGQVIAPGQPLWSVDGKAVPLLVGALTPWRAFAAGMSPGADVAALNHALIALGMGAGVRESDAFTTATATAIRRFQASLDLQQTGALALGAVFFEPSDIRVTTVHPQAGATVAGGAAVLDVTSTTPIVNVALSVGQTYLVKPGNAVQVTLPDGTATSGTVTAVGTVATVASDSGSSNNSSINSATVNVTIALDHATASGSLDQAPVSVSITNRSAHHVLAVPTTALLALAGGGDAVEVVDPNGSHRLVRVTTGIFDSQSGLVEVSGSRLSAGQKVVAAA
jgi:multidrug efflux pump subunit AcrA (membrane-fusion protein)